jgi:hypothetical protein
MDEKRLPPLFGSTLHACRVPSRKVHSLSISLQFPLKVPTATRGCTLEFHSGSEVSPPLHIVVSIYPLLDCGLDEFRSIF